jgi:hypothetical protein
MLMSIKEPGVSSRFAFSRTPVLLMSTVLPCPIEVMQLSDAALYDNVSFMGKRRAPRRSA